MTEETLFHQAQQTPPAARAAFLEGACGGDVALRRRVEALLRAHDNPGSFLGRPAVDLAATVDPPTRDGGGGGPACPGPRSASEIPGSQVGPYKLLEQIGEGGMGTVFMAEQARPLRWTVAVKIIKPGMDSRQVIARFEAERQALALMDHPNIARVLDAGTTDSGRPYFVMELVRGVPITAYCDEHRLTPRDRLGLFVQVCAAVQHAHQKGVIHRDLKPSNVLVAPHDGRPVPKVIDFGIAKATAGQQQLADGTMFTGFGAVVGTPEYMSPEQAELNQLDVDTRSDVYSLGVLLYELLTGSTPLDRSRFKEAALLEVLRVVREEEPPKPSTRLSTTEHLPSIAASRGLEPKKLSGVVRGELDWIVMRALEKDRGRRYETALGLARDVERYLADEPVQACPPSAAYRARKFVRRHRGPVAAAAVVGLALVVGVAGTAWQAVRANAEARRADRERGAAVDIAAKLSLEQEQTKQALRREQRLASLRGVLLADRTLAAGQSDVAERILDECPPDLRGWEWRYLKRQCHRALLTIRVTDVGGGPVRHPLTTVAISPDGARLACAGGGMGGSGRPTEVIVYDAITGGELLRLKGHERGIYYVTFSRDGSRLASAGDDGTVRVWEAATGTEVCALYHLDEAGKVRYQVLGVAFSPDGGRVASTGVGGRVKVWDMATRAPIVSFKAHGLYAHCAAFSPSGDVLVTCGHDQTVKTWDAATGQPRLTLVGHTGPVYHVALSPDGKRIASAGRDGICQGLGLRDE